MNWRAMLLKKRHDRKLGWTLLILALICIIDIPFPPLPPLHATGLAIILFIISLYFLYGGYKLPIREALLMAKEKNGRISVALLTMELGCNIEDAKKIIYILSRENLITLMDESMENGEEVYKVTGVE